jgi:hypothetical protein
MVFRTLEQIQQSADAIARTPIGVVRSVLGKERVVRPAELPPGRRGGEAMSNAQSRYQRYRR